MRMFLISDYVVAWLNGQRVGFPFIRRGFDSHCPCTFFLLSFTEASVAEVHLWTPLADVFSEAEWLALLYVTSDGI